MTEELKLIRSILPVVDDEQIAIMDIKPRTILVITSYGRLYSVGSKERKVTPNRQRRNYLYVTTEEYTKLFHREVAKHFIPNPDNKLYINHKDGNKANNHVNNLEWVTAQENQTHALANGLATLKKKNEGSVRFTNEQVARVVSLIKEKGYSYKAAGLTEGMSYSTIAHIMTGRRRKIEGIQQYVKKDKGN